MLFILPGELEDERETTKKHGKKTPTTVRGMK